MALVYNFKVCKYMFEIKYVLAPSENKYAELSSFDEVELRYYLVPGSLTLDDGCDAILVDWEWVPLLDFVICMWSICTKFAGMKNGEEILEFTESSDVLVLKKDEDSVKISASFTDTVLKTDYASFEREVKKFYKEIVLAVLSSDFRWKNSKTFSYYLAEVENFM